MNNEFIRRSDAVEILRARAEMAMGTPKEVFFAAADMLEKLPDVDAEHVRRGEWTDPYKYDIWDCHVCSRCKFVSDKKYIYCPNCGAKMI